MTLPIPINIYVMDKTLIKDLKAEVFLRSALIPIDNLSEILDLNDTLSGDQILGGLFKKSLRNFEQYYPLVYESKIAMEQLKKSPRQGWLTIESNFKLYTEGIIDEDQIILVPNSTPNLRTMASFPDYPTAYYQTAPISYQRPDIYLGDIFNQDFFYMRGICSRPLWIEYNPDKTFKDSPTSAVYWMNIQEGILGQKFLDQCVVDLLSYIRSLKSNMNLPGMSVDIFGAVDYEYQQLKSELDQFYLQSGWRGELLV